jgi:hypothetical protein
MDVVLERLVEICWRGPLPAVSKLADLPVPTGMKKDRSMSGGDQLNPWQLITHDI